MREVYERVADMVRRGAAGVVATVVRVEGSAPRHAGAKMVISADGSTCGTIGGGEVEASVILDAATVLRQGIPRVAAYEISERAGGGSICGGRVEVFLELLPKAESLYIFGAGHVARALAEMAQQVGFQVTVIDPRPELANLDRFAAPVGVAVRDFAEAAAELAPDPDACVVVVTPRHEHDEEVVRAVLGKPFRYVGMIGSRKKVASVLSNLRGAGFSEAEISKLHSPIGLDIGAETPEEIAVSILAELVAVRRKGTA